MWQQILQSVRSYDLPQRNVIAASCALGGGSLLVFWLLSRHRTRTIEMGDGWWGSGEKPSRDKENESIRPFQVKTSEKEIQDLYQRLDQARYTPPLDGAAFNYGFNSNYLQRVVSYWRNQFDWEKQVNILNQYPHYKTTIEGIEIHFIHVKPIHIPNGQTPRPLLMVHGWPGSFYEFYKIIPLLTNPSSDLVFEVICPSIPGYGFSEAPHKQGFNTVAAARIFHKLMYRLGFQEYYIQGGDWGSAITTNMAQMLPKSVKGLHLNMFFQTKLGLCDLMSLMLGAYVPWLVGFTREDSRRLFPYFEKNVYYLLRESGYMHIQATKPDTAGCGLNNCPVGLAAYILEKFSTWTDNKFTNLDDGGLERKYSLDDLLTNIMIYWVTSTIVPSMRFYKENFSKNPSTTPSGRTGVYVPTGVAAFPNELGHSPRSWVKRKMKKLVTYTYMPRGGHFAAFEEPELLAQDIKQFVRKVEHL
ncbi:LOW QUALITY PROTEIN: epoxide hydrolase 1-like [Sceloporus undulatus]|uniref:LOW QUALITY PROTEIN: epoxide hydrolase 1-like n=1 Tax=Sceloporus undulatus TaxID=8520 RepID=UPI001C4C814C|nr:LOW QUALITY PROTEIN: epoxide hydrolase 1-like [Sceloporus undulatus]